MSDIDTPDTPLTKKRIDRRNLIKKGAVAGAVVWTVPFIESVPAYAQTVGGSTITSACSYFSLVYTVNGTGPFASRVSASGSCTGNTTSNDVTWCYTCPGTTNTYDNAGVTSAIRLNGVPLLSSGCKSGDGTFQVSGNTITPGPGVVILFAIAHAGSLDSTTGQEPGTPTGTGFACNNALGQKKVNVACGPLSSASFSCLAPSS